MTKDDIKQKLLADSTWEPEEDASEEVWDMYDEAYEELVAEGKLIDTDEYDDEEDFEDDEDYDDNDM